MDLGKKLIYAQEKSTYSSEEQVLLSKLADAQSARQFYENLWQEFNYAYQMILYEYAVTRQFNPELPLEQQVAKMYPEKRLSDYKLPLEFAVITRQIATELANVPKVKWTSLADNSKSREGKSKIFQSVFDYVFDNCNGSWEQFKTLLAKAIYGTAMEHVFHEYQEYPDYEVSGVKDGVVEWKKITRVINQTRFKNKDLRHVFIDPNANDIDEAEHAFIATNLGYDTFKKIFSNEKLYDISQVKPCNLNEVFVSLGESRKARAPHVVQLMAYHDVPNNCMAYLANGRKINRKEMHIPVPAVNGKPMIPLAVYYESKADNEFYGISKCAIIKPFREVKNKLRNAFFDISKKMAFNTLVIDPMSDFDETTYEFGQPFIRAIPDEIKPLETSANLQPVIELDKQTDQDVITFTGINILNTAGGTSSESATKTAVRQESQVQLVELGLKMNSYHGFPRRAILLKQLIRLHYASARIQKIAGGPSEPMTITTKGVQLKRGFLNKNKVYEEKTSGLGKFSLRPEDFQDDVDYILEGGNVAITKELVKARQMEAAEFIKSIPADPNKQFAYNVDELVKWAITWGELPKEIATKAPPSIEDQTPEEITKGLNLLDKPPSTEDIINQTQNAEGNQSPQQGGQGGATPQGGRPLMAGTPQGQGGVSMSPPQ